MIVANVRQIRTSQQSQSFVWDFSKDGGSLATVIKSGIIIPTGAYVTGVTYRIITSVTGAGACLPGFKLGIASNDSMFSTFGCAPAILTSGYSAFKPSENSLKYQAIVTTTGSPPTPVAVLRNDFCIPFIGHVLGIGIFSIDTSNPALFTVGKTFVNWFNGNAGGVTLRAQCTAATNIDAYSYDVTGAGADNLTNNSYMSVEIYNTPSRISDGSELILTLVDGGQTGGAPGTNDLTAGKVLFTVHYEIAAI